MGRTRTRKTGSMNVAGTKKWDGTKWVPVNVARDGQRATRNGKPVVRKNGKWVPVKASTRTTNRRSSSGNKPTSKPTLKDIPASKRPKDMQAGKVYGELPTIPASKRPKDMQAGKVYGDAGQPPAPKLPPKPTATKPAPTKKPTPKPTAKPAAKKAQSKDMDANYKAWAKANPTLAKKVKKGQAGYKAVNSTSTKTKPAAGTGNHRGAGNGAPGAQRSSLKTKPTPTKPKPTPTKPKPTPPKTKQKPLTVPTNRIPKNLTGAAGRKYLADLDAGKLTRKRK